jgi:hypothetical protein
VRRPQRFLVSLLLLLTGTLTACSGDGEADADETPTTPPSSSRAPVVVPAPSAASKHLLGRAVDETLHGRRVAYTFSVTVDGADQLTGDGVWAGPVHGYDADLTYVSARSLDRSRMKVRSAGSRVWMQLPQWRGQAAGCWYALKSTDFPMTLLAFQPATPLYLTLLADLRAGNASGPTMSGSMRLVVATALLPGETIAGLGLTRSSVPAQARIPVEISLSDHGVRSVRVAGSTMRRAYEGVGVDFGGNLQTQGTANHLDGTEITLAYRPTAGGGTYRPVAGTEFSGRDRGCH